MMDGTGGCIAGLGLTALIFIGYGIFTLARWPITKEVPVGTLEYITSPLGWSLSVIGLFSFGLMFIYSLFPWPDITISSPWMLLGALVCLGAIGLQVFARKVLSRHRKSLW
jgi:hypothetical protein